MLAPVTKLDEWRRTHHRPAFIDYLRWNEAVETVLRTNIDAAFTIGFIWPRIILRVALGV